MNLIDFTRNGGYRFKQYTLRLMQEAYFLFLKAMVSFMNISEVGNYIISGCIVIGPDITPGYLYIDGDLVKFEGAPGTAASLIKKVISNENIAFRNGTNQDVIRKVTAIVHVTDGTALSGFTRIAPVFDANYVHTDNNYTDAEETKLGGIEDGAQVNVKPSWTAPEADPNGILDKPVGNLDTYLAKGYAIIGDMAGSVDVITISLGTDVGTSDYHVDGDLIGTFVGTDAGDARAAFVTKRKTNISFDILLSDHGNYGSQNYEFSWRVKPL